MIDGAEKVRAQQLGEFPRIDAIAFVADFQQRIPARIADQHLLDMGLEQVVQLNLFEVPGNHLRNKQGAPTTTRTENVISTSAWRGRSDLRDRP
jgi:hypothetical protein